MVPDGKRIAFQPPTDRGHGRRRLCPTCALRRHTHAGRDPAWSPDGRWIAFVRRQRGDVEREIWILRPDGSGARRLTSLHGSSINPAWSPNSARIVFASTSSVRSTTCTSSLSPTSAFAASRAGGPTRSSLPGRPTARASRSRRTGRSRPWISRGRRATLTSHSNNDSSPDWNPLRALAGRLAAQGSGIPRSGGASSPRPSTSVGARSRRRRRTSSARRTRSRPSFTARSSRCRPEG